MANLTANNVEATTFDLKWTIVFDGNSPITQARIEYFIVQEHGVVNVEIEIVVGTTPMFSTLADLTPNTTYNATVFLENSLGRSAPMSVVARTLLGMLVAME